MSALSELTIWIVSSWIWAGGVLSSREGAGVIISALSRRPQAAAVPMLTPRYHAPPLASAEPACSPAALILPGAIWPAR